MYKTCKTLECYNKAEKGRNYCSTCKKRKYRKNNPIRSTWHNLKWSAKQRGIPFDLSFKDFKQFATKVKYIQKKGIEKYSYHIDRIDEKQGYTKDNIQLLTNTDNVQKYVRFRHENPDGSKSFRVITNSTLDEVEGAPF